MDNITRNPIPPTLLHQIYASDQEMYPAPLTYDRLRGWVDACPELSILFTSVPNTKTDQANGDNSDDSQIGVVIILPILERYWRDLLSGRVKEVDVDPGVMFPAVVASRDGREGRQGDGEAQKVKVGLHVFHIERFGDGWAKVLATTVEGAGEKLGQGERPGGAEAERKEEKGKKKKRFAEFVLDEVDAVVSSRMKGWEVLGWSGEFAFQLSPLEQARHLASHVLFKALTIRLQYDYDANASPVALTATPEGKRAFERMGFVPTGYKEVLVSLSDAAAPPSSSSGECKTGKVEMVCTYPGGQEGGPESEGEEDRLVKEGHVVVSRTEMCVRFQVASR